jgi:hypothetical protein
MKGHPYFNIVKWFIKGQTFNGLGMATCPMVGSVWDGDTTNNNSTLNMYACFNVCGMTSLVCTNASA